MMTSTQQASKIQIMQIHGQPAKIVIMVDGYAVWVGPESMMAFHVDRHHRIWLYPYRTRMALRMDAIYPDHETIEALTNLGHSMAEAPQTLTRQMMREIQDLLAIENGELP